MRKDEKGWSIYGKIVNLNNYMPDKFSEKEYGIELGMENQETGKKHNSKLLIHDFDRRKEKCEEKIREILLKYGNNLPKA